MCYFFVNFEEYYQKQGGKMDEIGKYVFLWKDYLPIIRLLLKKVERENQEFTVDEFKFQRIGMRGKAGYGFNIVLVNGKNENNIKGVAVARDLLFAIKENPELYAWLKTQSVKIWMGKDFKLHLDKIPVKVTVAAETAAA